MCMTQCNLANLWREWFLLILLINRSTAEPVFSFNQNVLTINFDLCNIVCVKLFSFHIFDKYISKFKLCKFFLFYCYILFFFSISYTRHQYSELWWFTVGKTLLNTHTSYILIRFEYDVLNLLPHTLWGWLIRLFPPDQTPLQVI